MAPDRLIDQLRRFYVLHNGDKEMNSSITALELQAGCSRVDICQIHNRAAGYSLWHQPANESCSGNHAKQQIQSSRRDRTSTCLLIFVGIVTLLNGCGSHDKVNYEPALLNTPAYSSSYKLEGKVLVLTDNQDDQRMSSFAPESIFGSATRVEIPLGRIVGESATSAFGQLFANGADWLNPPAKFANYSVVVRPHVTSFSFRYDNTWSGPVVAVMETAVSVSILDNTGKVMWERSYQSGPFSGKPVKPPINDAQHMSPAIHQKIHDLMVRAALDFGDFQFQQYKPLMRTKPSDH
jgi:hypothetical protein